MKEITYKSHIGDQFWVASIVDTGKRLPLTPEDNPDDPTIVWAITLVIDGDTVFQSNWHSSILHPPTLASVMVAFISTLTDSAMQFVVKHAAVSVAEIADPDVHRIAHLR